MATRDRARDKLTLLGFGSSAGGASGSGSGSGSGTGSGSGIGSGIASGSGAGGASGSGSRETMSGLGVRTGGSPEEGICLFVLRQSSNCSLPKMLEQSIESS